MRIPRQSATFFTILIIAMLGYSIGSFPDEDMSEGPSCYMSTKPPHSSSSSCNTETNCRFGGQCRQVTDVAMADATVRFILPETVPGLDLTYLWDRRNRGRGKNNRRRHRDDTIFLQERKEECVCALGCRNDPPFSLDNPRLNSVCGSNRKTYPSECAMREESCRCQISITIKWRGPCYMQANCYSFGQSFVCNSKSRSILGCAHGYVYYTDVLASTRRKPHSNTFIDYETVTFPPSRFTGSGDGNDELCGGQRACRFGATCDQDSEDEPCKCIIACNAQSLSYVCGDDGRTYTSECQMRQAECRHQYEIEILHQGPCTKEEKRQYRSRNRSTLPPFSDVVEDVIGEEASGENENLQESDPCQSLDCKDNVIDAICGTDGIGYTNECAMKVAACMTNKKIEVKHRGYCKRDYGEIPSISPPERTDVDIDSRKEEDKSHPCYQIECMYGAVCVLHAQYKFMCSCEEICNQEYVDDRQFEFDSSSLRFLPAFMSNSGRNKGSDTQTNPEIEDIYNSKENWDPEESLQFEFVRNSSPSAPPNIDEEAEAKTVYLDGEREIKPAWMNEEDDIDIGIRRKRRDRYTRIRRGRSRRGDYIRRQRRKGDSTVQRRRIARDVSGMRKLINETLCGTDRKTYKNECEMRIEACHKKEMIGIKHIGSCVIQLRKPSVSSKESGQSVVKVTSVSTTRETIPLAEDDIETTSTTVTEKSETTKFIESRDEVVNLDILKVLNVPPSEIIDSDSANHSRSENPKSKLNAFHNSSDLQTREGEVNLEYLNMLDSPIGNLNKSLENTDIKMRDQVLPKERFRDLLDLNDSTSRDSINFSSTSNTFTSTVSTDSSSTVSKTEIVQENSSKVDYIPIALGVGFGQIAVMVLVAIFFVKNTRRKELQSSATEQKDEPDNLQDKEAT